MVLDSTPGTDASCKNLTEERDTFGKYDDKITSVFSIKMFNIVQI